MSRTVNCVKMGKEGEGLDFQPYPGELGKKVFESVSKEGWGLWMEHQTMLINEYRINPLDPKARKMIEEQMEQFFFGDGAQLPPDFRPATSKK